MIEKIKKALKIGMDAGVGCTLTHDQSAFLLGYLDAVEIYKEVYWKGSIFGEPDNFYVEVEE